MVSLLRISTVNASVILYFFMSLGFLFFVKIPGELSTDESLYLSDPSILYGPGVYLVQLYYRYVAVSPIINISIIAIALLIIAKFLMSKLFFCDVRVASFLFIFAILNPYFIYHSSSYLKDAPLAILSLTLFVLIKKKRFIGAGLVALILVVMRPPFFLTLPLIWLGVLSFRVVGTRYSIVLVVLYCLSAFVSIVYLVEKTNFYYSFVDVFESIRGGRYTILKYSGEEYWFPLAVLLNPFFAVFSEFIVPSGSMLLFVSGSYWVVYIGFLMCCINVIRLNYLALIFLAFLVFSVPQVFPETAARYFIQIPFFVFGLHLIFESEYVGKKG